MIKEKTGKKTFMRKLLLSKNSSITIAVSLMIFVCAGTKLFGQTPISTIDSFYTDLYKNGGINGSVLVAENGNVLYQKSFGYADFKNKIPNTENTVFQLASISKTITALAILQLAEKKKLSPDDKFITYFHDFPYPEITIRQLLSHTSGLADYTELFQPYTDSFPDSVFTDADIIPAMKKRKLPLHFEPGSSWGYCNINFDLLALLVEKISGTNFPEYATNNIFLPAGMKSTFVKTKSVRIDTLSNIAFNYDYASIISAVRTRVDSFASPSFKTEYKTFAIVGDRNVYRPQQTC